MHVSSGGSNRWNTSVRYADKYKINMSLSKACLNHWQRPIPPPLLNQVYTSEAPLPHLCRYLPAVEAVSYYPYTQPVSALNQTYPYCQSPLVRNRS